MESVPETAITLKVFVTVSVHEPLETTTAIVVLCVRVTDALAVMSSFPLRAAGLVTWMLLM